MKGVLAILGLVACATAFQYSIPQTGMLYGQQNKVYDEDLMADVYNRFHGPYNTQFYQQRFGKKYEGEHEYQKDSDYYLKNTDRYQGEEQEGTHGFHDLYKGLYKGLYNKYYKGAYNKYFGKFQDYLRKYQGEDSEDVQEMTTQYNHEDVEGTYKHGHFKTNDKYFMKKQQDVYKILRYINSKVYDNEYQQIYQTFDIEKFAQYYEPEAYRYFMHYWENQMFLPKGEIFSVFNDVHIKQVNALYKLFYTAKDYETFFKTAVWARQHMNEGMFLYTFSVAVVHREDTQGIVLPAIYEIYPQYFFNSEVMQKAYQYKMSHFGGKHMEKTGIYTIRSNYSGHYLNLQPEQSMSYYLEDVGLNAFYYYINLYFPYWMTSEEIGAQVQRGEVFYYLHQQLLAKYYLERLSHGVGGIDYFNWEVPFETGYYPSLTYPNGLAFTERPNFANLQEYFANYGQHWCFISKYGYGYTYVSTYEQRIREAIDLGYVYTQDGKKIDLYTPEGFNVLGNVIEGNADTVNYRYYGSYVNFARHLLGYAKQPLDNYKLAPSVLEHFETSLRDPAFYQMFKKITLLFQKYKHNLPAYTKKDLYYPGIKVVKVEVDPLVTFYDKFYADITNGLTVTPEEYQTDSTFRVQVQQYRLNHKNFDYKVYVNSDKTIKSVVKVFIGPKYDEHGRTMDFFENRVNFVEMDSFYYTLQAGQNTIVRNSRSMSWYGKDRSSYLDVYKNAMSYNQEGTYYQDDAMYKFPQRFILPRGSEEGMTYQMYVIVYPYVPYQGKHSFSHYQTKYNHVEDQEQGQHAYNYQTKYNQYDEQYQGEQTYNKYTTEYTPYSKMCLYNMIQLDNYPMGYPFDRPAEFEHVYFVPNAHIRDIKIYHKILETENVETKDYINEEPRYFM